jgi:hypothetical protein
MLNTHYEKNGGFAIGVVTAFSNCNDHLQLIIEINASCILQIALVATMQLIIYGHCIQ